MRDSLRETWAWAFQFVIVPSAGLAGAIFAMVGGPVPAAFYPVLAGMMAFPGAKILDWNRQKNGGPPQ